VALLDDACSGSPGVNAVVTALVLAASRTSASTPSVAWDLPWATAMRARLWRNLRTAHHRGESPALRLTRYFCNRGLKQPMAPMRQLLLVVVAVGKSSPEAGASIGRRDNRCSQPPKLGYHVDLTFKSGRFSGTSSHCPWNSDYSIRLSDGSRPMQKRPPYASGLGPMATRCTDHTHRTPSRKRRRYSPTRLPQPRDGEARQLASLELPASSEAGRHSARSRWPRRPRSTS